LAAIGAIGVGIGVFAFFKGSKIAGTGCFLTNLPMVRGEPLTIERIKGIYWVLSVKA
jgi:hypothetical protein